MYNAIRVLVLSAFGLFLINCQGKLESGGKTDQQSQAPAPAPAPAPSPGPSPNPSDFTGASAPVSVAPGAMAAITLTISKPLANAQAVAYQTMDDTAIMATHYVASQGTLNIAAGATSVSVNIATTNSMVADYSNKRFKVRFTFTGTTVAAVEAIVSFNVVPAKVSGLVGMGIYHSCSIKNAGLYCFGYGASGSLGNGALGNAINPTLVAGMDSGVTDVASGHYTTCAIKNGGLYCWGQNDYYQNGDGVGNAQNNFPRPVFDMASGVTAVSVGYLHTCAIKNAALYCWGYNAYAQVGHNNGTQQVPYRVPGYETGVTAVAAGSNHTCVIKNGGLTCWGYNAQGELGIGNTAINNARNPAAMALAPIVGLETNVVQVSTGGQAVCAVKSTGQLYCWGYNGYGQLGLGSTASNSAPQLINGFDANTTFVATAQSHTCAVKNGAVYCWGNNGYGQLGYNDTVARLAPAAVPVTVTLPAGERFISVAASFNVVSTGNIESSCARTSANKLYCWGYNGYGQAFGGANGTMGAGSILVPTLIPFF